MPSPPTLSRRLATTAAWPFGIALTSWDYMWRTTPLHRRERAGSAAEDGPPPLPSGVAPHGIQRPEDGVGPLFRRRYRATIVDTGLSAGEVVARLQANLNQAAPNEFARFLKVEGDEGAMRPGDEYVVRMPGPWDGPVRVVAVTPASFRLATLRGHLEAGQIEFRATDAADGVGFEIESWARSGDRLSRLLHQNLHMAKEVQLHMWTSFVERVARRLGGRLKGGIDIDTRRVDYEADDRPGPSGRARRQLAELRDRGLNFEPAERARFTPERGWHVDDYCQPLPPEPPGRPVPGGSWETARTLLRDYEFADPDIVRAAYDADRDLPGRDMLLEARWHGLRFRLGVRVGGVRDETRRTDGRDVQVWGWHYRTLRGHLEMGQMDFEVWKWLDSGEVEFRICAYSRRAPVRNPVVALGMRLFGRREQLRFARRACERMGRLTRQRLRGPGRQELVDQGVGQPGRDGGRRPPVAGDEGPVGGRLREDGKGLGGAGTVEAGA